MTKPVVLSGSTTSGVLTLGNYIGALGPWTELMNDYESYFMVANLHSLTSFQDPKELKERTVSFFAQYLALGLDPNRATIFLQSQVPEHAELTWVLTCQTPLGQLERMTQFKDKSANQKEIRAGLLMYPVLMAADILLYQPKYVPVGQDQKQHIELCRDLVDYFNNKFGPTFTHPEPMIPKVGAKIMSLQDPTKKMSKSDTDAHATISILDDPKVLEKKFKRAVTDSGTVVKYATENPGIANLMTIYSVLSGNSYEAIEKEFEGKMYGHLKMRVAEVVIEKLKPVQEKHRDLMNNRDHLEALMKKGADQARARAAKTLKMVYERVGLP
ncbi:MAG: tryptophan--tRNA ligase [Bdellovibrionaceae bacterium]|nr:tryptophan--tRNA ligase [Pseudobdellovibrionaceae bacterium]